MSNYGTNLLTPATIAAVRYAQQEQPALLQAAMKRCDTFAKDHQNADEVGGLARTIVASLLPPRYRMGYGESYAAPAPEGREVFTLSVTAARTATDRAAAAVAKDYRDLATLDALTASDPNALDRLAENDARLTLARYAPDPQSQHATTASDRLAAALATVHPEHAATLARAMDAWTADSRSLAAAVAMAAGWTNASKERRTYANHLRAALADLAPLAGEVTRNPHGRSTEQTEARTLPSRDRNRTRRAALAARTPGLSTQPYAERWTPEPATTHRPWTDAATEQAAAAIVRPGALAGGRFDPAATDATTASHVIVRTATATEVRDATDGHLIATRPAEDYPALLAATRQRAALAPRDRDRLTPGLPDQERAEKRAAAPTPGPVAKPSSRKRATTGSTGPTVPAWR